MSLLFGALTSDRVNVGSGASIDNITVGTLIVLAYPTSTADVRLYVKGTSAGANVLALSHGGGTPIIDLIRRRATTNLWVSATLANFSAYALNQWNWYAAVWDATGVDGDQVLYMGNLTTPFAGPSSYSQQLVGAGAVGDDSANDAFIGNNANFNVAFEGRIARVIKYNVRLTLPQLRAIQFGDAVFPGRVAYWKPGWNGTGTQPDYSGNGNAGTVTGATVDISPPIANPFGGLAPEISYAISGVTNEIHPAFNTLKGTVYPRQRIIGLRAGMSTALKPIGYPFSEISPATQLISRQDLAKVRPSGRKSRLVLLGKTPISEPFTPPPASELALEVKNHPWLK